MISQGIKMFALEAKLEFKEMFQYKITLVSDFIVFTILYLAIYLVNVDSGFMQYYTVGDADSKILVLVGYIFWQLNCLAIGNVSGSIKSDALRGLLETKMQSIFPLPMLILAQMLVGIVVELIAFCGVFLISWITIGVQLRGLYMVVLTFFVAIPSLCGAYGIGMVLGGLTLIEKSIGQFVYIIQVLLLFLSNTLSPTAGWYCYLLPFTKGVEMMRNIYLRKGVSGIDIIQYLGVNLLWLLLGVIMFRVFMKAVRKKGIFSGF